MRRRKNGFPSWLVVLAGAVLFVVFMTIRSGGAPPDEQAKEVVNHFYHYEQGGNFSKSWELFHSAMKEKFNRSAYIQVRAHVFMNDFDVETFTYKVGKPESLKSWKMSKKGKAISDVYRVPVTQTFKGKFGKFDVKQDVYAIKEKGEWRVMWDYNR